MTKSVCAHVHPSIDDQMHQRIIKLVFLTDPQNGSFRCCPGVAVIRLCPGAAGEYKDKGLVPKLQAMSRSIRCCFTLKPWLLSGGKGVIGKENMK